MLDALIEDFGYLEDWDDKYRYLIDLGANLPVFPEDQKTPDHQVEGCMSQVWLTYELRDGHYFFNATSDAMIVKGLIAVILMAYSGKTAAQIQSTHIEDLFHKLGLDEHLSPTRRNGFFAMVERIKALASKHETSSLR